MCIYYVFGICVFITHFCIRVFLYLLCLFEGRVCVRRRLRGAPSPPQKLEFHFSAESLHAKVVTARRDDYDDDDDDEGDGDTDHDYAVGRPAPWPTSTHDDGGDDDDHDAGGDVADGDQR